MFQAFFLRHLPLKSGNARRNAPTFDTPDRLLKQVTNCPTARVTLDRADGALVALHHSRNRVLRIGSAAIRHASRLIYATGMDLEKTEGTPIGVNCRLCERENCSQRAEPPITRTLILDENTRRVSSFAFSNAREL
jgi:predicted transcriptional regulator